MIRLQDLTPSVYYTQSRDFQFIGRLYDIVLNSIKTNADNLFDLPSGKNMDEKLLNLLATTLGFQSKHHYNTKHLEAICSVLSDILRNKGSLNAICIAVYALLGSEGITENFDYKIDPGKSITLYLPQELSDLSLLKDLLVYILPAGLSCNMVKEIKEISTLHTIVAISDHATAYTTETSSLGQILQLKPDVTTHEVSPDLTNLMSGKPEDKPGIVLNATIPGKDN